MYEFHADSWMRVGKLHPVCDDYALVSIKKDEVCAIISDGCSSVPFTGEGSRILARAALSTIHLFNDEKYGNIVLNKALEACNLLKLPINSLCCTLLVAKVVDNTIKVLMFGDGIIVGKLRNQDCWVVFSNHFFKKESTDSQPYYLYYETTQAYSDGWRSTTTINAINFKVDSNGEPFETSNKQIEWTPEQYTYTLPLEDYEWVGILSDGIFSFEEKTKSSTSMELTEVEAPKMIRALTKFNRLVGPFVEQRCKRAFKILAEQGCENVDDFSIAVIAIKEKEEKNESNSTKDS